MRQNKPPQSSDFGAVGFFAAILNLIQNIFLVAKAVSFIEDNYPSSITVSDIASFIGIERSYLHRFSNMGIETKGDLFLI